MSKRKRHPTPRVIPPFVLEPCPGPCDDVPPGIVGPRLNRRAARAVSDVGKVAMMEQARWPRNFAACVEIAIAALATLPADAGDDRRAVAMVTAIANSVGPGRHYWPMPEQIARAARDWRIYHLEFSGRNAADLARRYHMTVRGMQIILARQRKHEIAVRRRRAERRRTDAAR